MTNQTSVQPSTPLQQELRETLLRMHGPLLGGEALVAALGHKNAASLRQARRRGQVAITLFTVPNRRGWFALTQDVADWLANIRLQAQQKGGGSTSNL
ncbi:MAG: hypothetical protein ABL962_08745 [Fimbriimonadaceae bacterium]